MRSRIILPIIALSLGLLTLGQQPSGSANEKPWVAAQVMRPEDLARLLQNDKATRPKMFQVGFAILYKGKHIPGSIDAGPGSKDAGLEDLKKAVAGIPKDSPIILYCGCCPWDECPNVRPAFRFLDRMGFKQVKVLQIPTNFNTDWVEKGFPAEGSPAAAN